MKNSIWHDRFMELATLTSTWSKDPKTKVGCVIVDDQKRVLGLGYNGFPRGVDDSAERYSDKNTKLMIVKHAEENAVLNASSTEGGTAYVTLLPCCSCAGTLIQAGIKRIIAKVPDDIYYIQRKEKEISLMLQMLDEAGVEFYTI